MCLHQVSKCLGHLCGRIRKFHNGIKHLKPVQAEYAGLMMESLEPRLMLSTYIVTTNVDLDINHGGDVGVVSFRQALDFAMINPGDDIIQFDASLAGTTIDLNPVLGTILIDSNVDIQGVEGLTLAGPGNVTGWRIMETAADLTVSISDLTITGGFTLNNGAGIYQNGGSLTLERVRVIDNHAGDFSEAMPDNENNGGGIFSNGSLSLIDCLVADNSAEGMSYARGGGIYSTTGSLSITGSAIVDNRIETDYAGGERIGVGGGIYFNGTSFSMTNSTLSSNVADVKAGYGGGLAMAATTSATMVNATVTANHIALKGNPQFGGGCGIYGNGLLLHNTIVAGNTWNQYATMTGIDVNGNFNTASSHNLIGEIDGSTGLDTPGNDNLSGTAASPLDAMLGTLVYNGGLTPTHSLLVGSPAIEAGDNAQATAAGLTSDQRGMDRMRDGDDDTTATVDIGAFENAPYTITQSVFQPVIDANASDSLWTSTDAMTVDQVIWGTVDNDNDLSATWKARYDNVNLYFLVEVTDDVIVNDSGADWWQDDSIEIYIDADFSHGTSYDGVNDFQYGFRVNDSTIHLGDYSATETDGIVFNTTTGGSGYVFEASIPWETIGVDVLPEPSWRIGLDVHVNDDDDGGIRDGKKSWYGNDMAHIDPSLFAEVEMASDPALPVYDLVISTATDEFDDDFSDGDLSMREAVAIASLLAGKETITFKSSLNGSTITYDPSLGYISARGDFHLQGPGMDLLTVDVNDQYHMMEVRRASDVTVSGMAITNGQASYPSGSEHDNGAGFMMVSCKLTLDSVSITDCHADIDGGAVFNQSGYLYVYDSIITDNSCVHYGGGIFSNYTAHIYNTVFTGNTSMDGGGLWSSHELIVEDSLISGNTTTDTGGGGIWVSTNADITITRSTVINNIGAYAGGGIHNNGALLTLSDCTIAGNTAVKGGGIYHAANVPASYIVMTNMTITDNVADKDDAGTGSGGGVYDRAYAYDNTVTMHNSLVAGNVTGIAAPVDDDVYGNFNTASSGNLIGVIDGSTGLDTPGNQNISGTLLSPLDPKLEPLADNGGPTQTYALMTDSPAIDAGVNAMAEAAGLTRDQRKGPRLQDGELNGTATVDIGAYELNARPVAKTHTTPVIDGTIDALWNDVTAEDIDILIEGTVDNAADLSGSWRARWDDDNIYYLVEVTDDILYAEAPTDPWFDDMVEIFIDADDSHGLFYDGINDHQFGFRYDATTPTLHVGEFSANGSAGITFAMVAVTGGYVLEASIPWTTLGVEPSLNHFIGTDIHLVDDDDGGFRDAKLAWNSFDGSTHFITDRFGEVQLIADPTGVDVPVIHTVTPGDAQVALAWNAADPDALYYKLYKATAIGGPYSVAAVSFGGTNITDFQVYNDTTYYYRLSTVTITGEESDLSDIVSATPTAGGEATPVMPETQSTGDVEPDHDQAGATDSDEPAGKQVNAVKPGKIAVKLAKLTLAKAQLNWGTIQRQNLVAHHQNSLDPTGSPFDIFTAYRN